MSNKINLIGKKFGNLTVISELEERDKNGKIICRCLCDCGNYCNVKKINITTGRTKSCGCIKASSIDDNYFIGKTFGELTVISFSKKSKNIKYYKCICSCGNVIDVNCYNLKDGRSTNCGCKRKISVGDLNRKDIIGKKFGKLTVIKKIGVNNNKKTIYLCDCDCGNSIEVVAQSLISEHTTSCGCIKSFGNYSINSILKESGVDYKMEYHVDLSKMPQYNVSRLSFDAFLPEYNVAIEYDGEQHFKSIEFFGGEEGLRRTIERDEIKNRYCKDNNIILYRISYKDRDFIEDIIKEILQELIITNND